MRSNISLLQIGNRAGENPEERLDRVEAALRSEADADLIVLPELWHVGYSRFDDYRSEAQPLDGATVSMCAAAARALGCWVHVGSIVERLGERTLRNTAVLLDSAGEIRHLYSKVHVFGYRSKEAELLSPGSSLAVAETPFGRVAAVTCYDLRFPGLWSELSARGAEVVVVPAAWPSSRIEHWRLLTSARAVEHQLFVVACNGASDDPDAGLGGRSRIVDPTGAVLAEAGAAEGTVRAAIEPAEVAVWRNAFPVLRDRLTDYSLLTTDLEDR